MSYDKFSKWNNKKNNINNNLKSHIFHGFLRANDRVIARDPIACTTFFQKKSRMSNKMTAITHSKTIITISAALGSSFDASLVAGMIDCGCRSIITTWCSGLFDSIIPATSYPVKNAVARFPIWDTTSLPNNAMLLQEIILVFSRWLSLSIWSSRWFALSIGSSIILPNKVCRMDVISNSLLMFMFMHRIDKSSNIIIYITHIPPIS